MITNEHYYRALNIMDRIEEIRVEKNIKKSDIGKELGYTKAYYQAFYDACRTIRLSSLINFAKGLDISVDYLLTGKNKQPYKDFKLNYNLITDSKIKYLPNSLQVIKGRLKRKETDNISIKSLFEFEHYLNIPAIKLIGGE